MAVLILSCSKKSVSNNDLAPSNLTLTAEVSTDGSGNVVFTATANNASSYEYDFGNGVYQITATGNINYGYPLSGTYTVTVTAKNSIGQSINKSIQITVTKTLRLVWSDEFDNNGAPDAAKWNYDIGTGTGGWGNNELQYYTNRAGNVTVANGVLRITATKENYNGSAYTSSRLLTKDKFSFKYGKIEARAKLPAGMGTWPAIWMLGSNINTVVWPACGEIDIMEHRGSELNKIYTTVHYPGHSGSGGLGGNTTIANATTEFHLYSAEWNAAVINFFVDNKLVFSFPNNNSLPFNQNFFILINLAMGGNFGGNVDPSFSTATMEVDYVRVYN